MAYGLRDNVTNVNEVMAMGT